MDKIAVHYMAMAFVDEIERIHGPLDADSREFLYKEASLAKMKDTGLQLWRAGKKMMENPGEALGKLNMQAQNAAMKFQMSPIGQTMAMNPAAGTAILGTQLSSGALNAAGSALTGKGVGAALTTAAKGVSNPALSSGISGIGQVAGSFI